VSATATTARRLLEQTGRGPVVSLFFDLDPARFATAPARATQLRSLLDDARRQVTEGGDLDHDERVAVEQDLARIEQLLGGDQAPVSGARSLAVFASGQAGVLETVALPRPLDGRVVIARRPVIEPLVAGSSAERWAVVLVSRRRGRIFAGSRRSWASAAIGATTPTAATSRVAGHRPATSEATRRRPTRTCATSRPSWSVSGSRSASPASSSAARRRSPLGSGRHAAAMFARGWPPGGWRSTSTPRRRRTSRRLWPAPRGPRAPRTPRAMPSSRSTRPTPRCSANWRRRSVSSRP
jgi:hypothetical protein